MNFNDICKQYRSTEKKSGLKDQSIAKEILMKYKEKAKLLYPITGNYIGDLLTNYFLLKQNNNTQYLEKLMNDYHFNYSTSVRNAIYDMLSIEQDESYPLLWPGVNDIKRNDNLYILDTIIGTIKVSKASEIFKNTHSSYIFDEPLIGKCYSRSYDFVRENRDDYKVVLSYMPRFFSGGHYHAYIQNDSSILDIAANSYYLSKEDSGKILNGKIIKTMSYSQVESEYKRLSKRMKLPNGFCEKLSFLALYYDYKDMHK